MAILKRKKRQVRYAYLTVFNPTDEYARIVLQDMCRAHHVFDGGFDPDPHVHAFQAGERNAVLRILTLLKLSPDEIAELPED